MKRRNIALTILFLFFIVAMILLSILFNESVGLVGVFKVALGWG